MAFFNLPFGVRVAGSDPVDGDRYVAADLTARNALVTAGRSYDGLQVYVESNSTLYILKGAVWTEIGGGGGGSGELTQEVITTIDVGAIDAGTTLPLGLSFTDFVIQLTSPTLPPVLTTLNSVVLNGVTTATSEIGTPYSNTLTPVYNQGLITDGDGVTTVPLTGVATTALFTGAGINSSTGVVSTPIVAGANTWAVQQSYAAGTDPYFDSSGTPSTIFDAQRVAGNVSDTSNVITGKYRSWWYSGTAAAPTTSAGVRALTDTNFYSSSFNINIPANDTNIAFYVPDTVSSVTVLYVQSSNADVTGSFVATPVSVDDAGGNPVGYTKYEAVTTGYPTLATYAVTLTP